MGRNVLQQPEETSGSRTYEFAPQVSGSGEGAMPELGRAACGNRVPADRTVAPPSAGSGISDPRSASLSSRRRLTNPKG